MPVLMKYKAKSIIYFKNDTSEKIYVLQKGKINICSEDIETREEIREPIKIGEFFGVKSALGHYLREETINVVADSAVLVFSVPEFEQLLLNNSRITLQMLKVFSNQLRLIHKKVSNLLADGESDNAEEGLYKGALYYYKKGKYKQAFYSFRRYLTFYSAGQFKAEVSAYLKKCEEILQKGAGNVSEDPAAEKKQEKAVTAEQRAREQDESSKEYYNALDSYNEEKYGDALKLFQKIAVSSGSDEFRFKAIFDIGRCYFSMKKYAECIQYFIKVVYKYPKHPDLCEILFYLGEAFKMQGDKNKALGFFNKVMTMAEEGSEIMRKTKKTIKSLKGA